MDKNSTNQDKSQTGGMEIEKTHEDYVKGFPAPGTRHAGEEGRDYVAHHENKDDEQQDNRNEYPKSM